jgi:two-component system, cell cycle response regulator
MDRRDIMMHKVFVVDDNKKNIRLLREILEDNFFEVYPFENGLSVVAMAKELKPSIILLDIMMPEMDGFEVCQALKQDLETQDIPVIMITAKAEGADVKRGLESGAFDYIKKPIDEVETLARIQAVLRFKDEQDQLKERAMKDSMTGLFNHALLMDLFQKEYAKAERNNDPLSFVMLDIDFFKKVNDTYGHKAGDHVLRGIASILNLTVRQSDMVGRYGGDEFGLILPGISSEHALQLCERLRKSVEEHIFHLDTVVMITVSIGVCNRSLEFTEYKEMIRMADKMLYEAKAKGRNRVIMG